MERYKVCHYCGSLVDTQDEYSECFPGSNVYYCDDNCYRKEEKKETPKDIEKLNEKQ